MDKEKLEFQINLFPFVIEALGNNRKIYPDIDKIYQMNKYEFYKAAKDHELYNHQIITEGSIIQEEYCKKILGIIAGSNEEDERIENEIGKLIIKGYKYTSTYVENHLTIDISKYLKSFTKKHKENKYDAANDISYNLVILIFLSVNLQKNIIKDDIYNGFLEKLQSRWEHYSDAEETRIDINKASDIDRMRIKELKQQIYRQYGYIKCYEDILDKQFEEQKMEQCAFLFDYERLSSISIFEDVKFKEKDIDEILYLYILVNDDLEDIQDATKYLITHMYMKYLIKAYKQVKQMYFKNNKETMFVELEGLESKLKYATQRLSITQERLSESEKKYIEKEKETLKLREELAEERKNREELNSLREFLFNLDKQEVDLEVEEVNSEALKGYKAVLIGGHERWQSKMKELLPSFIFIHPDRINFDTKVFDGVDTLFIYTQYNNHAIYKRAINAIRGKNIKVAYLNEPNEDRVLQKIYKVKKTYKPSPLNY